jgi:CheY-like chemotaxis protein
MKRRILAIDDSKAIRYLLHTLLSKNYQVITAADGCSAINWLSQNGLYGSIPTIVLSALEQSETSIKCEELGLARFFTKPFNPIDLIDEVHKTIRQIDAVVEMSN